MALRKLPKELLAFQVAVMLIHQFTRTPNDLLSFPDALFDFLVFTLAQKRSAALKNLIRVTQDSSPSRTPDCTGTSCT
jgi:hypothetical protein